MASARIAPEFCRSIAPRRSIRDRRSSFCDSPATILDPITPLKIPFPLMAPCTIVRPERSNQSMHSINSLIPRIHQCFVGVCQLGWHYEVVKTQKKTADLIGSLRFIPICALANYAIRRRRLTAISGTTVPNSPNSPNVPQMPPLLPVCARSCIVKTSVCGCCSPLGTCPFCAPSNSN
jgi:hypothetical protein